MAAKFHHPGIVRPRPQDVAEMAQVLGFECSDQEIEVYTESLGSMLTSLQGVDVLPRETLPVTCPRTPGRRPTESENPHNAWSRLVEIQTCDERADKNRPGIVHGLTVAVKDSICLAGVPMANGSKVLEGYIPDVDATCVTRVLENGGKIIGKAHCENLCVSGNSFTNAYGCVTNPVDTTRTAGGSSSGCAALVKAGAVDVAIGGDQGGSVRIPSAFCGIVGLKPTFSLVPYTGAASMEASCDHLGPMARTVLDCAKLLQAMAGWDAGPHDSARDPRQQKHLTAKPPAYGQLVSELQPAKEVRTLRLACVRQAFDACQSAVQEAVKKVVDQLASHGAEMTWVDVPEHPETALRIWEGVFSEGMKISAEICKGANAGHTGYYNESLTEAVSRGMETRARDLSYSTKLLFLHGEHLQRTQPHAVYCKAQNARHKLRSAYDAAMDGCDALIMPTMVCVAMKLPTADRPASVKEYVDQAIGELITNTAPFNVTGHPALTLPAGTALPPADEYGAGGAGDGAAPVPMPVGLQVVGRHFEDSQVLRVGAIIEAMLAGDA